MKQNGLLSHPQDLDAPLRLAAQRKINGYRQRYADNQNISFLPSIVSTCHIHPHARLVFASSFSTGPPGDRGEFHCRWNVITTQQIGLVPFQARGILPVAEEQSRTRGGQSSGGITDQPQCRGLWHSSSPSARSLSRSPSSPFPSFTQSPSPPRSLVRDGQTSPHRPRLVESHSTCLSLSPCPHANSFVTGTAIINNNRDLHVLSPIAPRVPPRYCGRRACGRDDTTAGMPGRWQACTVCGRNEMISCGIPFMKRPLNVPAEDFA